MRQKISKSTIDKLRPGGILADSNPIGFVARRLKSGAVTYGFRYRDKQSGQQRWIGLGLHGDMTPDQARKKALKVAGEVRDGGTPVSAAVAGAKRRQAAAHSVDEMLDNFLARHVRPNLRSADEVERVFRVYVRPKIGTKSIYDLKRRDIVELLDQIEDSGAPVQADRVLAHLRKAMRWFSAPDDGFSVPLVPGMARTKPAERARKRVFDDQEIRDLHTALDTLDGKVPACFPNFVRTLFLTATRLRMVSDMTWDEIEGRDWTVPGTRNKGGREHLVPLTDTVIGLLGKRRKGYVFSSDNGRTAFKGFSKSKAALDAKLAEVRKRDGRKPMQAWVFHDLRRTSRSLMSRAGVSADVAEMTLGQALPTIRRTYDRHEYRAEKLAALERLGALVDRVLKPGESVVSFPKTRKVKARPAR
jgi:integrase